MRKICIGVALLLQTFTGLSFSAPAGDLVSAVLAWTASGKIANLGAAFTGRAAAHLTPIPGDSILCQSLDGTIKCSCEGRCIVGQSSCGCG